MLISTLYTPESVLSRVNTLLVAMQERAAALDVSAEFPETDMNALRRAGVLRAPVPLRRGGLGFGTEPIGAWKLLALLRLLGTANLSLGRLFEAHVNAARLIFRYGDEAIQQRVADDLTAGHLVGLWVTDPPDGGLRVSAAGILDGRKQFCSACTHATRAVVTAIDSDGNERLVYASNEVGFSFSALPGGLSGMRGSATGQIHYSQGNGTVFGEAADYLREPDFSAGAWRTSAVVSGGIEALTEQLRSQLIIRRRASAPAQQARVGQSLIAAETARLWIAEASVRAEAENPDTDAVVAYVGLARLAVERAALEVMELTQRSLGIEAFRVSNPVERLCRDLATYLRQPAGDEVLMNAAALALKV